MLYVISGCSCGGKSSLINALASCGYETSDEPGRDIVRRELREGGSALPWSEPVAFAKKCVELAVQRYAVAVSLNTCVFFDRSLVDAVSALAFCEPHLAQPYLRMLDEYRYASTVFMAPPWPEIFEHDTERKNTYENSVAEYDRLVTSYALAGYAIRVLPQVSVHERVRFVLTHIE